MVGHSHVALSFVRPPGASATGQTRGDGEELEIGIGDRLVDLVREGIDCVLRAGEPKTLDEFKAHRAVNYASAMGKVLPFEFVVDGERRSVHLRGSVTVSHADAYVACCEAGLGFVQLPRYHVQRQLSPRVRVFVDWVADQMRRAR